MQNYTRSEAEETTATTVGRGKPYYSVPLTSLPHLLPTLCSTLSLSPCRLKIIKSKIQQQSSAIPTCLQNNFNHARFAQAARTQRKPIRTLSSFLLYIACPYFCERQNLRESVRPVDKKIFIQKFIFSHLRFFSPRLPRSSHQSAPCQVFCYI